MPDPYAKLDYFEPWEFDCPCGECDVTGDQMAAAFLRQLDLGRNFSGVAFKINSGLRCAAYNAQVGGSETSSHLPDRACAADIDCTSSAQRHQILQGLWKAGFTRIGVGPDFIHVDGDAKKPSGVVWLYC